MAGQVEQIIVNLAVNARDAMPHDGRLVVEWKYFEVDAQFAGAHTGVQAGPLVILAASDTGTGMKPEVKAAGQSAVRSASFRRLPHRCAPESHPPVASGASGGPEMLSTAAAAGPEPRS